MAIVALGILLPGAAAAQDTRAGEITKKQEEKAAVSKPYELSRYEKIMTGMENSFVSPPSGFFPFFGSVYSGGGFTPGAGYRQFYAREAVWDVKGMYSIKNYKLIEVGTRTPWNNDGRWTVGIRGGWRDAPQIGYYGIGQDASKDDRANFRIKQTYLIGEAAVRPTRWTRLEGEVAYEDFKNEEGQGKAPSIETVYDAASAPGLFQNIKYIRSRGDGRDRLALLARLLAEGRLLRRRDARLRRPGQDVQLSPARRRSHPAPAHPSRELGSLVPRPRAVDARR